MPLEHRSLAATGSLSHNCGKHVRAVFAALAILLGLPWSGAAYGADDPKFNVSQLAAIPPFSAISNIARTLQMPLEGIDGPVATNRLTAGESVAALITLRDKGGRLSQWLVWLVVDDPTPKELSNRPAPDMVMYNSMGDKFTFSSRPAFARLRILGPCVDANYKGRPPKVMDEQARVVLDQGFLSLGLDQTAALLYRIKKSKMDADLHVAPTAYSEDKIKEGRALREKLKITMDEARAFSGMIPALLSYFKIVQGTPGLSDVLFKLIDRPSTWSLIRNGGIGNVEFQWGLKNLGREDSLSWGLMGGNSPYRAPIVLTLNGKAALELTLVVTEPKPPLLATAGVVGLLVEKPGEPNLGLSFRVISAHRAKPHAMAPASK